MVASTHPRGIRLVKRIYLPRIVGLGLGGLCVAAALVQHGAPRWAWGLLATNAFVWPHVAYHWARRCKSPYLGEHRNLLIDAASGGFWVVAMGFNLLPSVLILTMLSMDNVAVGGIRQFLRGLIAHLAGALLAWPLFGLTFEPASNLFVIAACIPFLLTYPLLIGVITFRLASQLTEQKRELEALSQRDALSGLCSRGYWERRLAEEFSRYRRHRRPVTLLLADLDHFKVINDTHGHVFGDEAIRHVGRLLREQMRQDDIIGRYGGEEFGVILPETSAAEAQQAAERIRRALAAAPITSDPEVRLTASFGIACLSHRVSDHHRWLEQADRALYQAKNDGRNCIRVFSEADEAAATASTVDPPR
ncbi:MAG TPA: diguanylate cyclase [Burkholderiales bacterium]|nr:diguanylate cyclase [Burkholderiales bacterium]